MPCSGTTSVWSEAVLKREIWPVAVPVAAGAKSALKDFLLPGFRVSGSESPLRLSPAPVAVAAEMVRLAVPVLVSMTGKALVSPTITSPKLTLLGAALSTPMSVPEPNP